MGLTSAAHQEIQRAVRIDPNHAHAWRTVGGIESELGNVEATKAAYQKAFELAPDAASSYLDLTATALDTADYVRVAELCAIILDRFPEKAAEVYHCQAMVAYRQSRFEESIVLYDKAIAADCQFIDIARWNRSLPLLAIGRYKEGWAAAEARGTQKGSVEFGIALRRFDRPLLKLDEHKPPARVHLHEEMGYGDTLAMLRYVPLLTNMGYDVRLEVRKPLLALVQRSFPSVKVMEDAPDYPGALNIPDFDYHHSLLSLPHVFGTEVDTVPWSGPYLKPDQEKVEEWRKRLPAGKKIGLVWSAGVRKGIWLTTYGLRKSLPLKPLTRICRSIDATFISLQVGPERAELEGVDGILDVLPKEPSWDDTAALVSCLDCVVTVDTAVSHLAGALGKPVFLAMHREGSWHYLADVPGASWVNSSPWYPNTRLYRQTAVNRWDDVISRICLDLVEL